MKRKLKRAPEAILGRGGGQEVSKNRERIEQDGYDIRRERGKKSKGRKINWRILRRINPLTLLSLYRRYRLEDFFRVYPR